MSNNIGKKVANIEAEQPWLPITQVKVKVDESNVYTAGTTTGRTFEVDCAIGSQAVADNLLSVLNGYVYKAYEARDALIKPNIELGQSVSVGDVYSIVGNISIKGDMILAADLSAPSSGELDHEYPYDQWKKVVVDAKNIRHGGSHGTVSGAAITPETIEETQVAPNAITNAKIAFAAITARCLAASAVTEDAIAVDAVTATKLSIAAVTARAIAAAAVSNAACNSTINQSLADADYSADVFSGAVEASYGKFRELHIGQVWYWGSTRLRTRTIQNVIDNNLSVVSTY